MPGASGPIGGDKIKVYYLESANLPEQPADLDAANLIAVDANLLGHTTGDFTVPGVEGTSAAAPNIEWREHNADAVLHRIDITPAPTSDDVTMDLEYVVHFDDTAHQALISAAARTYAVVILDFQSDEGDGTRGSAGTNAVGTLICLVVRHGDAPVTGPSSAANSQGTTTFTLINDSADAKGRKFFHYGA